MVVAVTFFAYLLGGLLGLLVERGGPRLRRDWPIYLRVQLVATAALLGLVSAWRLTAPRQVVGPIVVACVGFVILGAAWLTRRGASPGQAALESWAAFPNGTFWVLPVAGALVGPTATTIAALSNAAYSAPGAVCIHLLRRDAPVPQRRATSWVDQSAVLAVFVGLLLHLAGPAPEGTKWVLYVAGPLLAFVGAALFTGSILHPHNLAVGYPRIDVRRWLALSSVRVAYFVPVAVLAGSTALTVIAVLSALGPPAFNPPQLAVLYGYRSGVVNAAARFGWLLLPLGLVVAAVLR